MLCHSMTIADIIFQTTDVHMSVHAALILASCTVQKVGNNLDHPQLVLKMFCDAYAWMGVCVGM